MRPGGKQYFYPKILAVVGFCIATRLLSALKKNIFSQACLIVAMFLPLCQTTGLSVSYICLLTYVHIHSRTLQDDCMLSCLVLLVLSFPQAHMLSTHKSAIMPARICTDRHNHACTYSHICGIMPEHICTDRCDHACTYMHIRAQS